MKDLLLELLATLEGHPCQGISGRRAVNNYSTFMMEDTRDRRADPRSTSELADAHGHSAKKEELGGPTPLLPA